MTFDLPTIDALLRAVAGISLAGVVGHYLILIAPKLADKLAAEVNLAEQHAKNAIVKHLIAEGIAYFKANEAALSAKGTTLADYAVQHVLVKYPGVIAQDDVEHAVQAFLAELSTSLH